MRRKLLVICLFLGIILSANRLNVAQATNPPSLAGSWQLTLTAVGPAAVAQVPVHGLATFTPDGSMVETDATEVVPTVGASGMMIYGTPGHGIWQPGPAVGTLFIQFIRLLIQHTETLHAKKTVTITGALDSTGNHFSGHYEYEAVGPAGHVIATGAGNVSGERIPHPLLP